MGIQAMHNEMLVYYSTSCEDWTAVEDSFHCGFRAYNSPFYKRGEVMGFLLSLNSERV